MRRETLKVNLLITNGKYIEDVTFVGYIVLFGIQNFSIIRILFTEYAFACLFKESLTMEPAREGSRIVVSQLERQLTKNMKNNRNRFASLIEIPSFYRSKYLFLFFYVLYIANVFLVTSCDINTKQVCCTTFSQRHPVSEESSQFLSSLIFRLITV